MTVRVLVVDDHPVVREGICAVLATEEDIDVVGQADGGEEAIALVDQVQPDLLVLDLMMPGRAGLDVITEVTDHFPDVRVLVLSMHDSEGYVVEALRRGAHGYAVKQAAAADLVRAVRSVAVGRRYLSPALTDRAIEVYANGAPPRSDPFATLTGREREVVALVAHGATNAAIAERLFISVRTVETHRARAMRKLGLRTSADVVRFALRQGLLPPEE